MTSARLLIIDDDPMLSEQLRSLLLVLGYPGLCCADSRQALEIAENHPFELIFCDYWMPGLNGQGFYFSLCRGRPDLARRVVWLVGAAQGTRTEFFLRSTGNPRLLKPFKLPQVQELLAELLGPPEPPDVPQSRTEARLAAV